MHEMSIALRILDLALEESRRRGGAAVKAIHARIGPLSGVAMESLVSAFQLARECFPLGDCRLILEEAPLVVYCPSCAHERSAASIQNLCCSQCGSAAGAVIGGRELEVTAMEVEYPGPPDQPTPMETQA